MHEPQPPIVVSGSLSCPDHPVWAPLELLVPLELCGEFMYMCEIDLDDGSALQAYKHRITRRYLHLDDEGHPYGYLGFRDYRRVRHHDAVEHVFCPWWILRHATEAERDTLRELLDQAAELDSADWDAGLSVPPRRI